MGKRKISLKWNEKGKKEKIISKDVTEKIGVWLWMERKEEDEEKMLYHLDLSMCVLWSRKKNGRVIIYQQQTIYIHTVERAFLLIPFHATMTAAMNKSEKFNNFRIHFVSVCVFVWAWS